MKCLRDEAWTFSVTSASELISPARNWRLAPLLVLQLSSQHDSASRTVLPPPLPHDDKLSRLVGYLNKFPDSSELDV